MVLAHRLLFLRENRHLSQGDVERRTGLLRCYISRVENGHTVPAIENLEKLAHAMGCRSMKSCPRDKSRPSR
jgi:transcriptional regulator with XRE-family HTH domain